jgi:anti-sigma factor RsiW
MRCPRRKTLQEFLDGELPGKKSEELEGHLASCQKCRDAAAGTRAERDLARETLRQLDPETIPIPALGYDGAPVTQARPAHGRRPWAAALLQSPAAALLMGALFLAGLFLGMSLRGAAPAAGEIGGTTAPMAFYFAGGNAVRTVSLDLDMTGYRPLDQPRVILIAEERK